MARTPMTPEAALEAVETALGGARPYGVKNINSENRTHVRAWLVAQGLRSTYVQNLGLDDLRKVYADTSNTQLAFMRTLSNGRDQQEQTDQEAEEAELFTPKPAQDRKPAPSAADAEKASRMLADALAAITGLNTPAPADLDEARVIALVKQHAPKPETAFIRVEVKLPDRPEIKSDEAPRHEAFEEVLGACAAGLHVLMVGPAGSGKTHLAEQVSHALGLTFGFTGAVASEYKLLGFTDAHGKTVRTIYRERYEHGGLFLWDEMDASAASAMLPFNAGLANGHQDFPDGLIPRHTDFRAIASANTYGHGADRQYVGRNQMDAASLDRFYVVPMDYDERLERTLFGDDEWTRYIHKARRAIRTLNIRHVVSMRAIDQGKRALAAGVKRESVERAVLWKHLSAADITKIKGAM